MEFIGIHPGRKIISYFAITILIGTALLYLPVSSGEREIGLLDALFTSTSAVCVTGLVVVDTGSDFSLFGQIVILLLIQLGGLGIMTFATSLLMMMRGKVSFFDRLGINQEFGSGGSTGSLLLAVLITTLAVEGLGAVGLFFEFRGDFPADVAAYHAIFHSISAFCNAGFSTLPHGLETYSDSPSTILIVSGLIISGGLGFIVIRDLLAKAKNPRSRLSLHTKLCLSMTLILIVFGTVAFMISESENLLVGGNWIYNASNAFFESVTCRTAGFNTIPQNHLTEVSLVIAFILMFIGACPGSTGGGIKTTTTAVILLLVYHRFMGRKSVAVFKRSIDADSVNRSVTLILLSSLIIVVLFAALMFAEEKLLPHQLSHGWFVDNLFEIVSAFGTVGLSLGITSSVTIPGKIVLIAAMFIGRVGLLTLAFGLARQPQKGEVTYADESVMVG
ncbi:MAG: potassium transporter TrkG [Candidatus Zixiibacteriota bacterium]